MCFKKIFGWFKKSKSGNTSEVEKNTDDQVVENVNDTLFEDNNTTEDFVPNEANEVTDSTNENYVIKSEDKVINVYAPVDGEVKEMRFIQDQVFKQNLLGEGLFISPKYNDLKEKISFFSPVDGEVINFFHVGHYYTIRQNFENSSSFQDFIIHIGVDSVEAGEDAFEKKVELKSKISHNDPLCIVDLEKLLKSASSIDTPILVSAETLSNCKIVNKKIGQVKRGDLIYQVIEKKS